MKRVAILLALFFLVAGCAHSVGYAGAHPGYVQCKGKGTITGNGFQGIAAVFGGNGSNGFTITADCGDGLTIQQGNPKDLVTPLGK